MQLGHAASMTSPVAEALRDLLSRVDNRVAKHDWQLSGDDSKAVHYARRALEAYDAACNAPLYSEAERMVGG